MYTVYKRDNIVEHVQDHAPSAQGAVLKIPWRRYKIFNYHAPNKPIPHSLPVVVYKSAPC